MTTATATARINPPTVGQRTSSTDSVRVVAAHQDSLVADMLAWQRHAACRGLEAEIFYPSEDDETAFEAKAVCAACAVSGECLEYAITVREKEGVWGGQTAAERVRIIRRRRRAAARARNAQAAAASN